MHKPTTIHCHDHASISKTCRYFVAHDILKERARRQSPHGLTAACAKVTQYYLRDCSYEKSRQRRCARGYVFTVVTCFHPSNWHLPLSGSHKKFHFSYMKFLCLLKFLFIKVLKENSFHFNGFPMVLQWAQRQQFLKFKFKFKFIYSHLFNYNTTTIRNKKQS